MQINYYRLILILLVSISSEIQAASYYGSGYYSDIGIGLQYDDNVSHAQLDSDVEEDFINVFEGQYGYQSIISQNSLINVYGQATYRRMNEFKSLNNFELSLAADYFYQPDTGFFYPWYELSLRIGHLKFNNSHIRDSETLNSTIKLGKRFTDNITGIVEYQYDQRFSREKVFDLVNHSLLADLEFRLSNRTLFYSTYKISVGDTVSTAVPNTRIIAAAETVAPDDVFSAGTGPGCLNRRCAYRLDAVSHNISAGFNFTLMDKLELDLSTQYHRSYADGDNYYYGFIYSTAIWIIF